MCSNQTNKDQSVFTALVAEAIDKEIIMIYMNRNFGESLKFCDDVTVKILGLERCGEVRIGIDAPREVIVDREEVFKKRKAWYNN